MTTQQINPYTLPGIRPRNPILKTILGQERYHEEHIVIQVVCEHFNVKPLEIKSPSRERIYAIPRQICMFLLYRIKTPEYTMKSIGLMFNRDHSTVVYAIQTVQDLLDTDKAFRKQVKNLQDLLKQIKDDAEQIENAKKQNA